MANLPFSDIIPANSMSTTHQMNALVRKVPIQDILIGYNAQHTTR